MNHEECRLLLGSLSDYIDGDLEDTLCLEIEKHMAECERCRIVVDSLNKTVSLYHTADSQVTVPPDVRQRLFMRLNLEDYIK
jgi:predicted anti-sigma-YlaC factor YlaD